MTLDEFRQEYPEFRTATSGFLQKYLDNARVYVSEAVFGTSWNHAHGLKTADLLARSPSGRAARLVAKDETTTYGKALDALTRTRVTGVSVV